MMNVPVEEVLQLTASLIEIPSVTGEEKQVADYLAEWIRQRNWPLEVIPIDENRYNILVVFGEPRFIFSTHMDVVPAPELLFTPRFEADRVCGRGACDAKGSIATMLILAENLRRESATDFGLLFVVGEERDGIGAKTATKALQGRGVQYFLNGEPTEGRFSSATKGILEFRLEFAGRSCHSGYPEYGEDANRALLTTAEKLYSSDFGADPVLGASLVNIGVITGGSASNVISDYARMSCCIRTITSSNALIKQAVADACAPAVPVFNNDSPAVRLSVPEWEISPYIAAYGTDVPHYLTLGCEFFLCGPGSILLAHTDQESLSAEEIAVAYRSYARLFETVGRSG